MPSMHRCDTRRVVFRIEIELATQLQKYASEHARSINDILRDFIQDLVKDVELTEQDYLDIAAEVARNVEKRKESGIR